MRGTGEFPTDADEFGRGYLRGFAAAQKVLPITWEDVELIKFLAAGQDMKDDYDSGMALAAKLEAYFLSIAKV